MNPSLAARLRLGFGIMLVLLVVVTVVGVGRLFQLRQDFEDRNSRAFQLELATERMRSAFILEQAALRGTGGRNRDSARRTHRRAVSVFGQAAAAGRRLASEPESRRLLDRAVAAERRWREEVAAPLLGGRRGASGADRSLRSLPAGRANRLARAAIDADGALIDRQQELRLALRREVRNDTRGTMVWVLAGLIAAFGAAVLAFGGLVGAMRRPLDSLVEAARQVARGDLDARAEVGGPGETASLGMAFNEMAGDLQEAYRRVEEERLRLATMIESLGDGLITTDPDGHITLTNPSARELLPAAALGARVEEAFGELAPDPDLLRELTAGGPAELRLAAGEAVLAVVISPLATREGGAVFSIRDMSEPARLERMKDEFVATVSHELRSPLTSIKGFAELLMLSREGLSKEQVQSVQIIEESTAELVSLVNDLLDLARSDAGRLTVMARPSETAALIAEAAAPMRPRLRKKRQQLELRIEDGLPMLFAEPARVRQILTNLLTNAHLYTQQGGSIELAARRDGESVELSVTDDGPGIPPEQLDHLFDRFWRGRPGERQEVGGTGLGLPIVKSLVDLHGGQIRVESEPGRGTAFHVVMPAVETDHLPGREALVGKRVLLLERDPVLSRLLVRRLAEAGVVVEVAVPDAAGLEPLEERSFDLIAVDVPARDVAGLDVLTALREHERALEAPLLIISILPGREVRNGERRAAVPADGEALIETATASLARRKQLIVACRDSQRRARVAAAFAAQGMQPRLAASAEEALALARAIEFDLLLIDTALPNAEALKVAIDQRVSEGPPARVVMLDERTGGEGPPMITVEELVERVLRALEASKPAVARKASAAS